MGKKKKKSALFLCPGCGAFVSEDASKCTKCGQVLDSAPEPEPPEQVPEPEEPEPEARPETEAPTAESPQDSQPVTLFLCSACGAFTSGDAKVCPNCGASMGEEPETEPLIKPGDAEAELLDMLVQAEPGKHEPESLIDDLKKIESEEDVESFIKSIPEEEAELAPEPPPAVAGASLDEEDILGMLVSEGQEPEPTGPDVGRAKQQPDPEAGSPDEKPQRMHIDDNDTIALCASCGAFVSETAEVCNICGHRLKEGRLMARDRPQAQKDRMSGEEADSILRSVMHVREDAELDGEAGDRFQSDAGLNLCTVCGAFMSQNAEACAVCGTHIEDMPEFVPSVDVAGPEKEKQGLALCPHCGAFLQEGATECFSCVKPIPEGAKLASFEEEQEEDQTDRASNLLKTFLGVEKSLKLIPAKETAFSGFELCPDCGAFVSPQAVVCSICGSPLFEGAEDLEDIDRKVGEAESFPCPNCRTELAPGSVKCTLCGFNFIGPKEPEPAKGPGEDISGLIEEELEASIQKLEDEAAAAEPAAAPRPEPDDGLTGLLVSKETMEEVAQLPDEEEPPELKEILDEIESQPEEIEDIVREEEAQQPEPEPVEFIGEPEPEPAPEPEPEPEEQYLEEDMAGEEPASVKGVGPSPSHQRPANWPSGVYFSMIAISFSIFFYLVMPGDYAPGLSFLSGTMLVYGVYLWLTDKGTFFRGDMRQASVFGLGTLIALFAAAHWPMGILASDTGSLGQPTADRILVSVSILLLAVGLLWMRARVRYVFSWFSGSVLMLAASLLAFAGQGVVPDDLSPAGLIFGLGAGLCVLSFALLQYEKALNTTIESDVVRGDAHYLKRDYHRALDSYNDALTKVRTKDVQVLSSPLVQYDVPWYSKGSALVLMGRVEEGIKCLDMALAINPNNEVTWVNKGNAHTKLGDHDAALECYRRAIDCNPFYEVAWNNLGNSHARKKRYLEALKGYNRAIKINPKYDDAWINKGYVLAKMGKREQAVKCLEHVGARAKGPMPVMDRDVHTL